MVCVKIRPQTTKTGVMWLFPFKYLRLTSYGFEPYPHGYIVDVEDFWWRMFCSNDALHRTLNHNCRKLFKKWKNKIFTSSSGEFGWKEFVEPSILIKECGRFFLGFNDPSVHTFKNTEPISPVSFVSLWLVVFFLTSSTSLYIQTKFKIHAE